MTHARDPEYATPMDEAIGRYGYVEDGCYQEWVFMYQGKTYTSYAFNKWQALERIANEQGLDFWEVNVAEWELLDIPTAQGGEPAKQ